MHRPSVLGEGSVQGHTGRVSVLWVSSTRWPHAPRQRRDDREEALPSRRSRALGTLGQSLSTVLPEVSGWGCWVAVTTPVCPGPRVTSLWSA